MPIDGTPLFSTGYRVNPLLLQWVQGELEDFLHPQNWELSKEKDGKSMWRKHFPKEVTAHESASHRNAAYWKFSAVIPGASVDDLYDLMHRQCTKYQEYLSEGFEKAELVEMIPPERAGGWPDEAAVQYRAYKIPMVGRRDFLTLTMQKNFTLPDGRPGIGLFTTSLYDYPNSNKIAGVEDYTRAEVLSCCVFLVPTPEGCSYTYTQRAVVHLIIPLPSAIIHLGEKSHIWRHFDTIRQCVVMHQQQKQRQQASVSRAPAGKPLPAGQQPARPMIRN
eukprot:RCo023196